MVTLIGYRVYAGINEKFQTVDEIPDRAKVASNRMEGMYSGVLDNSFLFLTIGLAVASFALAALVRIHPIFIIFYLVALTFIIVITGIFSNIYTKMAGQANLIAYADNLVIISHVMKYLPFFVGIFGSLLALVMYKAYRVSQVEAI